MAIRAKHQMSIHPSPISRRLIGASSLSLSSPPPAPTAEQQQQQQLMHRCHSSGQTPRLLSDIAVVSDLMPYHPTPSPPSA